MIVHYVQNHAYSCFVQSLNHLLELFNTAYRIIRIGRIAAIRHIVVHRIIAPVIAIESQLRLIHRTVVIRRKYLHMRHTQLLQMVYSRRVSFSCLSAKLCQSQELTFMLHTRCRMNTEVAMVHLIHHRIRRAQQLRTFVSIPSFGVCFVHVNNRSPMTIYAHSCCKDTRSLVQLPLGIAFAHQERIEITFPISNNRGLPSAVNATSHRTTNNRLRILLSRINGQNCRIRIRTPKRETGLIRKINNFPHISSFNRILVHRLIHRFTTITAQ